MEKYGVYQNELRSKTADTKNNGVCMYCGSKLEPMEDVGVIKCPNCGTIDVFKDVAKIPW